MPDYFFKGGECRNRKQCMTKSSECRSLCGCIVSTKAMDDYFLIIGTYEQERHTLWFTYINLCNNIAE